MIPDFFQSIVLGLIQGLTEFIPVSSSGHLVIAQKLMGIESPSVFYLLVLHLATLLATFIVFRKELKRLLLAIPRLPGFILKGCQKAQDPSCWLWVLIGITTLITGMLGFVFHSYFETMFSSLGHRAFGFLCAGLLLWSTQFLNRGTKTISDLKFSDGAWVGFTQGLAALLGISRSGTTITTALGLGFERSLAGEYSFLISIPAVLGATLMEAKKGLQFDPSQWSAYVIGFVVSFVFGYLSLVYLLRWIRKGQLHYFAYYCFLMSAFAIYLAPRI